jgi:23S rRNA (adenine2030-N6)-methyltransferase
MRELVRYPRGPLIERRLMRDDDVLMVNELHTEDPDALAELFHRDRQATVIGLDGCEALKALLPPKERRGIILVDPRSRFLASLSGWRTPSAQRTSGLRVV